MTPRTQGDTPQNVKNVPIFVSVIFGITTALLLLGWICGPFIEIRYVGVDWLIGCSMGRIAYTKSIGNNEWESTGWELNKRVVDDFDPFGLCLPSRFLDHGQSVANQVWPVWIPTLISTIALILSVIGSRPTWFTRIRRRIAYRMIWAAVLVVITVSSLRVVDERFGELPLFVRPLLAIIAYLLLLISCTWPGDDRILNICILFTIGVVLSYFSVIHYSQFTGVTFGLPMVLVSMTITTTIVSLAGAAVLFAVKWSTDYFHSRNRPGLCPKCKYNLTGNLSGICPECGTAIPPEHMKRIKNAAAPMVTSVGDEATGL